MPDGYTLEPRLVETRQEARKPQLLETINLHLPDGPAVRAKIVHLTFISPSTYASLSADDPMTSAASSHARGPLASQHCHK